jgi:hypothetical protein
VKMHLRRDNVKELCKGESETKRTLEKTFTLPDPVRPTSLFGQLGKIYRCSATHRLRLFPQT